MIVHADDVAKIARQNSEHELKLIIESIDLSAKKGHREVSFPANLFNNFKDWDSILRQNGIRVETDYVSTLMPFRYKEIIIISW